MKVMESKEATKGERTSPSARRKGAGADRASPARADRPGSAAQQCRWSSLGWRATQGWRRNGCAIGARPAHPGLRAGLVAVPRRQGAGDPQKFGMPVTRYYQLLNALIDRPE